ncbi:MAG: hypothetical protein KJP17_08855 [Gammaproteobacteria bacterium]|nr:hypothetical protein [Gammaproteobacteria bacterium]
MAIRGMLDRLPAPLRVVLTRWLIYIVAALPGFVMLRSHLNDTIGKRPWFQDAGMPLDYLSVKLLMAELSGGAGLLIVGVALAWILQLIWLAGAVRVLDPDSGAESGKVFANGRPYLWRFLKIAFVTLLAAALVHLGVKHLFEILSARAEVQGWPVEKSYIDLNLWRGGVLFVLLTLIGVFAFWWRVLAVATGEPKLRRLLRPTFRLYRRHPGSVLLLQFAAVVVVLGLQAMALYAWRQSGGGIPWFAAWLLLLLFAAWVWQWRVSSALRIVRRGL